MQTDLYPHTIFERPKKSLQNSENQVHRESNDSMMSLDGAKSKDGKTMRMKKQTSP
jgi:hypothetical protein